MMTWLATAALAGSLVEIPGGSYAPLYPAVPEQPVTEVAGFRLDDRPITAGEFAGFLAEHTSWDKGSVSPLLADAGYLRHSQTQDQPITNVSWFAARAYCSAQGKRLPSEDEWEYVARASTTQRDASDDPEHLRQLLAWYSSPGSSTLADVGSRPPNIYGIHDMHGLTWEWVEDFNNTLFGTDSREGGDEDELRFCGSGTLSATDVSDYARFMRIAFRSSLRGSYTTSNLGFRCAAGLEDPS